MLPKAQLTARFQNVWLWMSDDTNVVIWSLRTFLHSSSVYSCHLFYITSASVGSIHCVLYCASLSMKCSFDISSFLDEIYSLSILLFSSVSLHWSLRKAFLFPCYSLELCIQLSIPFPFSLTFQVSSFLRQPLRKAYSDTLPSYISFFLWDGFAHCLLYNVTNLCP